MTSPESSSSAHARPSLGSLAEINKMFRFFFGGGVGGGLGEGEGVQFSPQKPRVLEKVPALCGIEGCLGPSKTMWPTIKPI